MQLIAYLAFMPHYQKRTWAVCPSPFFSGAICRNRTDDLIITSDVLYQLS